MTPVNAGAVYVPAESSKKVVTIPASSVTVTIAPLTAGNWLFSETSLVVDNSTLLSPGWSVITASTTYFGSTPSISTSITLRQELKSSIIKTNNSQLLPNFRIPRPIPFGDFLIQKVFRTSGGLLCTHIFNTKGGNTDDTACPAKAGGWTDNNGYFIPPRRDKNRIILIKSVFPGLVFLFFILCIKKSV